MSSTKRRFSFLLATSLVLGSCIALPAAASAVDEENGAAPVFTLEAFSSGLIETSSGDLAARGAAKEIGSELVEARISGDESSAAILDASLIAKGGLAAAGPGFVDLSWSPSGTTSPTYQVFRDDELIAETVGTEFRDLSMTLGASYNYRVETVVSPDSAAPLDEEQTIRGFEVYVPATDDITVEVANQNSVIEAKAANMATTVQYKTFIPQAKLNAPIGGCAYGSGYKFGGDNRGYSTGQVSSRTNVGASVGWAANSFNWSAQNGVTTVYNSAGALVASQTAPTTDMWVKKLSGNTTYADLRFSVKSANPFCGGNSIQGAFTISVTKNGAYSVSSGSHRQMPNHEIYVMGTGNMTWKTVYRRAYASELCLVSMLCPEATITGSGTY